MADLKVPTNGSNPTADSPIPIEVPRGASTDAVPVRERQNVLSSDEHLANPSNTAVPSFDEWMNSQGAAAAPSFEDWMAGNDMAQKDRTVLPYSEPFLQRVSFGKTFDQFLKAITEGTKEGFGDGPIGLDEEHIKNLQQIGWFPDPATGKAGPLRTLNQATLTPLAAGLDVMQRAFNVPTTIFSKMVAQVEKNIDPATSEEQMKKTEARTKEMVDFAQMAMLSGGPMPTFSRPSVSEMNTVVDKTVGGPVTEGSVARAAGVLLDETYSVDLKKTYTEQGVTPAEVFHDAATNSTIVTDLAQRNPPTAYGLTETQRAVAEGTFNKAEYDRIRAGVDQKVGDGPRAGNADRIAPFIQKGITEPKDLVDALRGIGYGAEDAARIVDDFTLRPGEKPKELAPVEQPKEAPQPTPITIETKNGTPGTPMTKEESLAQAERQIDSMIVTDEKKDPWWSKFPTLAQLRTKIFDRLNPINEVVKQAGLADAPTNAYKLFRLTAGGAGKADVWFEHSPFNFVTYQNEGKALKDILDPFLNKVQVTADGTITDTGLNMDAFRRYIMAKRDIELQQRGIKTGLNLDDSLTIVQQYDKTSDKFATAQKELVDYQNSLTKYLRDAGVINQDTYDAIVKMNTQYVPWYRVFEDDSLPLTNRTTLQSRNPLKELEGSDKEIYDPIESIVKNTYAYINLAEKNAAGRELVQAMERIDLEAGDGKASLFTEIANAKLDDANIPIMELLNKYNVDSIDLAKLVSDQTARRNSQDSIVVYFDGVGRRFKVADPDLLAAWSNMDPLARSWTMAALNAPSRLLRGGATLDPTFMVKNIFRDLRTAMVNTSKGVFTPFRSIMGAYSYLSKDQYYQDWLKGGGSNAALIALDRATLQQRLFQLHTKEMSTVSAHVWNSVTLPFRTLQAISAITENMTRVGEFRAQVGSGPRTKVGIQAAAFVARNISADYSVRGASVGLRMWAAGTTFFNAQLRNLDTLYQAGKKNPGRTTAAIMLTSVVPTILLWEANHDDPRYKEVPDWQKKAFFIYMTDNWKTIPNSDVGKYPRGFLRKLPDGTWQRNDGNILKFPKNPVDVLFGAMTEAVLDAWVEDQGPTKASFGNIAGNLMGFTVPTLISGAVEQATNIKLYSGNSLIPGSLEVGLPEYEQTPYTTETAKALSKWILAFPGMRATATNPDSSMRGVAHAITSPILLENYVQSFTGGLGRLALQLTDLSLRKAGIVPDVHKPILSLADIPVVGAFVARYPTASVESIQTFYSRNQQNEMIMKSLMSQIRNNNPKEVDYILKAYGLRKNLTGVGTALAGINQMIRNIYKDPSMKDVEKQQLIETNYYQMIMIAREGTKILDQIDALAEQARKAR